MRVVEVGEAQRVAEEKHRRIVADDVPVTLFGIELQREAADIALGVRGAALACDCGEACEHGGLFADLRKYLCLGVARDVVGDGECAVRAGAFGVHPPLRDYFAGEMRQLFDQPNVLQ